MKNDGVNWEALVDKRLAEVRRDQRAEAQKAEPPPSAEATAEVLNKIRAATEAGAPKAEPPAPPLYGEDVSDVAPARPARAPRTHESGREKKHHHRSARHDKKRLITIAVLAVIFIAGVCLTFSPQIRQFLRFIGPERETSENGIVVPVDKPAVQPPSKEEKPPKPQNIEDAKPPVTEPPKVLAPAVPEKEKPVNTQPAKTEPEPKPKPKTNDDTRTGRDPKEEPVPLVPATPIDPSVMPKPEPPPEAPRLPAPNMKPWDSQGEGRKVAPRDNVG